MKEAFHPLSSKYVNLSDAICVSVAAGHFRFVFHICTEWRRFLVSRHRWWNPFFFYSLPVAVFRLSSGKLGNIALARTKTVNLSSRFPTLPFHFHDTLSFLPSVDYVETATGVFPQSCNYSQGKRVILSAYSRISGCVSLCLCACLACPSYFVPVLGISMP